jgi:hypothetical protein
MGKMNQGPLPERASFIFVAHAENTQENQEGGRRRKGVEESDSEISVEQKAQGWEKSEVYPKQSTARRKLPVSCAVSGSSTKGHPSIVSASPGVGRESISRNTVDCTARIAPETRKMVFSA